LIPCLIIPEDQAEIAAQHLVCSYLVRACREAMYELAFDDPSESHVRREAIRLFKMVHDDWLEARKALAALATQSDLVSHPLPEHPDQPFALTTDNK
jgi:hypothetical protein